VTTALAGLKATLLDGSTGRFDKTFCARPKQLRIRRIKG
jgi:hypothetical protein